MPAIETEGILIAVPDLRVVGGHDTARGRRVRSGRPYRSVVLDEAPDNDPGQAARLDIRTIFDLGTSAERERRPAKVPPGAACVSLHTFVD